MEGIDQDHGMEEALGRRWQPEAIGTVTPSEAVSKLNAMLGLKRWDPEVLHLQADRLLLGVLLHLGQRDVVEAYTAAGRRVGFYFA